MALLDLAVDYNFKFTFAVTSFALYSQTLAYRIFVPLYRHFIPAVRAFYFHPLGGFGLQNISSFQKMLEKVYRLWYTV